MTLQIMPWVCSTDNFLSPIFLQRGEFTVKNATLYLHKLSWHLFLFSIKKFVFLSFPFLFFDEVSNLCKRIYPIRNRNRWYEIASGIVCPSNNSKLKVVRINLVEKAFVTVSSKAATRVVLYKKLFLKISQYSQENPYVGVSFNKVADLQVFNTGIFLWILRKF